MSVNATDDTRNPAFPEFRVHHHAYFMPSTLTSTNSENQNITKSNSHRVRLNNTHDVPNNHTCTKIRMNFFDAHGRYLLFFSEATIDMVSRSPLRVTPTSTASSSGSSFINTCTPFNWFRWIKSLWHLRIYQGTFHDISTRYIHQWSFRSKCTTFPFLTSTTQSRLCSQSHFITVVFMDGGTTISPLVTRQAMNWSPIISELRQLAL